MLPLMPKFWFGCSAGGWARLLRDNRFGVAWYWWPLILLISMATLGNAVLGWFARIRFNRVVRQAAVGDAPVFIIGHWRSGTTLLHRLLCQDAAHTYPTLYACCQPNHFLLTAKLVTKLFPIPQGATRLLDDAGVDWDNPEEEELALCNLGIPSPYVDAVFPQNAGLYDAYYTLHSLSSAERNRWMQTYTSFLRQVTAHRPGRLVLKNPLNSFRINILRERFPEARFIHVIRDPFEVYASSLRALHVMTCSQSLQRGNEPDWSEYVLGRYVRLQEAIDDARGDVPAGHYAEVRFEDLIRNPSGELRRLYDELGLPWTEALGQTDLATDHRKRGSRDKDERERKLIMQHWGAYIQRWGYASSGPITSRASV